MSDRTRREYLRDFGIVAGTAGVAGCLGGGDDEESPTNTSTDTTGTTPNDTTTEENTTEGEETTEDGGNTTDRENERSFGEAVRSIPESIGGNDVSGYAHAKVDQIDETISSATSSGYAEKNVLVPHWADIGLSELREVAASQAIIGGSNSRIKSYDFDGDISDSISDELSEQQEFDGYTLYTFSDSEMPDQAIAYNENEGHALEVISGDISDLQREESVFSVHIDAKRGDTPRFIDMDEGFGLAVVNFPYDDVVVLGTNEENDEYLAGGTNIDYIDEKNGETDFLDLSRTGEADVYRETEWSPSDIEGDFF